MNRVGMILIAIAASGFCSCALMFKGTTEQVSVTSEPPGATATLSTGETHVTPFTLTVPRDQDLELHFAKPGYQSTDVSDETHVMGGYLFADFVTFVWPIDAATGAYFEHQQSTVIAHLDPQAVASDQPATDPSAPSREEPVPGGAVGHN